MVTPAWRDGSSGPGVRILLNAFLIQFHHSGEPFAGFVEVLPFVSGVALGAGCDEAARFAILRQAPDTTADIVLIHRCHPTVCLLQIPGESAAAVGHAVLRDEDRKTGLGAFHHAVPKLILVGGRVEVEGVHEIVEFQRVGQCLIHALGPVRSTTDDYRPRSICTDDGNDFIGVGLDVAPIGIVGLIAYLVNDVYDLSSVEKATGKIHNSFDDILQRWGAKERRLKEGEYSRNKVHIWNSAMFPPPFLEFELNIHAIESGEPVKFEILSSGERQQLFTISSLLYHLDNLNSIKDDEYDKERVFYPHVTIVLEEIELYFHPEMQQSFVRYLMDGILSINLEHLKSIHFILVTHSPYVLSDIPRANILALNEQSEPVDVTSLKAFGANIHDMLRKSFFLGNGAIGSYAQWEIKHIAACLNIHRWAKQKDADYTNYSEILENESYEFIERYTTTTNQDPKRRYFEYEWFQEELGPKQLKQKIDLIDEPVLHNALMHQYCDVFGIAVASKEEKRQRLLQQLKQLDEDDTI